MNHGLLAVSLLLPLVGCGDDSSRTGHSDVGNDTAPMDVQDGGDTTSDATTDVDGDVVADAQPDVPTELTVSEADFDCLTNWEGVRGFFLTNLLGDTAEAVRVAEGGFAEPTPVGTIVQLVPFEAMVKLPTGSSPETNDWEYFLLSNTSAGTEIVERGFAEVENLAGSCNGCHANAASRDFICEDTGLCAAAALPRDVVDQLVEGDPRCE